MEIDEYKFLKWNPKIALPVLVLAIMQDPKYLREFNFRPNRKWLKVQHQVAGYACHQVYMDATILNPKEPEKLVLLNNEYLDSCIGCFGQTLDEIINYRKRIVDLFDVDCNISFRDLEEGIYPIDATKENLEKICTDNLPEDLDMLIDWKNNLDKTFGIINRWDIYILGDNCD